MKGAFVAFLSLALLLSGCDGAEDREAKYLKRAETLYEAGKLVKARLEFQNALQISPRNTEAAYHLGLIAESQQDWQQAFGFFSRVTEQNPKHASAQLKLGQYYILTNNLDQALEKAEIVIGLDPDNAAARALRGAVYLRRGDSNAAEEEGRAARAIDPSSVAAASLLTFVHATAGDTNKAINVLDDALEHNAEEQSLRLLKIVLHAQRGEFPEVEALYQKLIKLDPETSQHRVNLARTYTSRERLDEAEKILRETITLFPHEMKQKLLLVAFLLERRSPAVAKDQMKAFVNDAPDEMILRLRLADLYAQTGSPDKAESVVREVIRQDKDGPHGVEARLALAQFLINRDEHEEADALLSEVWEVDPSNDQALLLRASRRLEKDAPDDAIADLRTFLGNNPRSKEALGMLAEAHLRLGDNELAIESLRYLVEVDPDNIGARLQLARLAAEQGYHSAALAQLNEVLERDPQSLPALLRRVEALIAVKDWAQAEAAARDFLSATDKKALGYQTLGKVFQFAQKYDEAIDSYKKVLDLDPQAHEPLTALAQTFVSKGQSDEAVEFLKGHISKAPNNPVGHNLLGEIYAAQREIELAKGEFEKAAELDQAWRTPVLNLGRMYQIAAEPEQATETFKEGLKHIEGDARLQFALALAYQERGEYEAARKVYKALLDAEPNMDSAANNLAILITTFGYENQADLDAALKLVERFQDSDNPYFLDTLGWVHYRLGNISETILYLKRAIASGLDIPELHYHMGMAYRASNQPDRARAHLEKAVAEGAKYPGFEEARNTLANL